MVARIKGLRSMSRILNYNESKVEKSEAELLFAGGFPMTLDNLDIKSKVEVFEKLTCQNLISKLNRFHISLNFSPMDKLDKSALILIANDYLSGMGLGNQPYLVYQHFDAGHPHIHIATVSVENGGNLLQHRRFESFFVSKRLEIDYNLEKAEDHAKKNAHFGIAVELRRVQYGKEETWKGMSTVVNVVVKSYKYSSLPELNAVLNQFGISVEPGRLSHNSKGLLYSIINEKGERVGQPIMASALYGKPTLATLEKHFALNLSPREPYGQRLRIILDKALSLGNRQEMEYVLHKNGIRIVFNENPAGKVVGAYYIDNAMGVVYSDFNLGEKYHASEVKTIIDKMPGPDQVQLYGATEISQQIIMDSWRALTEPESVAKVKAYPANELPVVQTFKDNLYDVYEDQQQQHQQRRKLALEKSKSRQIDSELEI